MPFVFNPLSGKFDAVNSAVDTSGFLLNTGDTATGDYTFDTDTLFIDSTNHRVGVGIVLPLEKLSITAGNVSIDKSYKLYLSKNYAAEQNRTWIKSDSADGTDLTLHAATASGGDNRIRLQIGGVNKLTMGDLYTYTPNSLGVGTTIPIGKMQITADAGYCIGAFTAFTNTAAEHPTLYLMRGRGTNASPLRISSGDELGRLRFAGQFSNVVGQYTTGAYIGALAAETWASGNSVGTNLVFYTTPKTTSTPLLRATLNDAGFLCLGTTAPAYKLDVVGSQFEIARVKGTDSASLILDAGSGATFSLHSSYLTSGVLVIAAGATNTVGTGRLMEFDNAGNVKLGINNKWLRQTDTAGSYVNLFSLNASNEIDCGGQLNISGYIEGPTDGGAITIFDMPVTSGSADNTEMSATFKIDGTNLLKLYAQSDGAGAVDTPRIIMTADVGIGTTTPDTKLQVVGALKTGDDNTNYSNFDTTGHQTMVGNARPWRDEITDALNIKNTGTAGVVIDPAEGTLTFTHGAGLTDYAYCNMQLNHDKDLTSTIYPHIHWFAAEQAVVPNFMLQYRWQTLGGAKVTSWTDYKCNTMLTTAPGAGATVHAICGNNTGIAVPGGTSISDIVQFRIIRDHSDDNTGSLFSNTDDPYTATVHMLAFDCHFQINSLGSTDELTK